MIDKVIEIEPLDDLDFGKVTAELRSKRREQDTIVLFHPSDSCQENLHHFIAGAKKIHGSMFDYGVNWDDLIWDIRGFESTTSLKDLTHASNVLFTQDNGKGPKIKVSRKDEVPFAEPFATFAKAFVTHRHNEKPKSHSNHMVAIKALRLLYQELPNSLTPCVSQLLPEHFNKAISCAMGTQAKPTLYVTGVHLTAIAESLDEYRLTATPMTWKNPIPRNYKHGGASQNRGGKEAKKERAKQLPKTDLLLFLAALWGTYEEIEERDKALVCMSIILLLCGFRMDEFIGLDLNCIPSREEYDKLPLEIDPETGTLARILRIRVLAKKKGHWDEKIVPHCTVDTIYIAVERLKALSKPQRLTAQIMLEEGKWNRFLEFDDDDYLTSREVKEHLGFPGASATNTISTLALHGIQRDPSSLKRKTRFRVGDIHDGFCDRYRERISPIINGFGHDELIIPIWEFLTLRYLNQYTPKERLNVFAEPLTGTQVQDFFKGRDYETRVGREKKRILNVFERYSFPELELITKSLRSHQFRHLLNSLMQEADVFSQEDIAKNFLRKGTQDNNAYNHQIAPTKYAERTREFQEKVLVNINLDSNQAKDVIQRFPLLTPEELQEDMDEAGSFHFTDIGRCRHDYTQGPCGMHYMCLRNCINYKRTKGDIGEVDKITSRRNQALVQMKLAKVDANDDFEGANNWYLNHKELVDGCNQALAIETDERHKPGAVVQIFPNGTDRCEDDDE
ncbi:hypothetical protein [Shewanella baltica]|uniref:hypothetical protein n=2 Tax=Shewanella baltica TaxID=62322 RepID=UPI00217E0030|nr:hypothetical protein [Shewanella baltica]MCS6210774.1 hypothetical protein [Shewanella baltica]